ncbi:hypothetical protein FKM82_018352 [Ascaphus truei]
MEDFKKDQHYSDLAEHSAPASEQHEEENDIPVVTTRRLRDRDLLKRRKEEAQEKDTFQWVLGEQAKSKWQRKGKGNGRGRKKYQAKVPESEVQEEQIENGRAHDEGSVVTVTVDVPPVIHEEAGGHASQDNICLLTGKEEELEAGLAPVAELPEVLNFPLDAEQREQGYYIPLL